jgi:membrane protease YdiL (CAAX protease family)
LPRNSTQPAFRRSYQFTLFLAGVLWIIAANAASSRAAQGIVTRLNLPIFDELLEQAFFLFLLLCGFSTLRWIATRSYSDIRAINALPSRSTTGQEWERGVALGWGMLLVALLPMMLTGTLHPAFAFAPRNWALALLSLVTIAIATLALEVAFRGFVFARLIDAIGPTAATIFLSMLYAYISATRPNATGLSIIITFLLAVLFSQAYLRTRALWLGWGMHFAWNASMAILFGLPIAGYATYNNLVFTSVTGPDWLTGGTYGPEAAFLTLIVLIAAMFVLQRITRNYAWNYTHAPIISAGYPMDIAPPAAHTAMEAATPPAPLVQILSTTPTTSSTMPVIDEHLRRDNDPVD